MIYPDITISDDSNNEVKELGKAPFFDVKTGQHTLNNGSLVNCCDADVIRQWIYKTIMTPLNKYLIYEGESYGVGVSKYIGTRGYYDGYIASELKREITEQLLIHSFIKNVTNFNVEKVKREFKISFTVNLIDGSNIDVSEFTVKEGR